jgi:transposase InsO family protein
LPASRHISRPKSNISEPNEAHQADLLFLQHDRVGHKTYKCALTVVDAGSRYKEAEPLTTKSSTEVAQALTRIYKRGPLTWPRLWMSDPGREFLGEVSHLLEKHGTMIRRGRVEIQGDQGIVERFNRTLVERLFGFQYAQEMLLAARGSSERSVAWVARLPAVVEAINAESTWLTSKRPVDAIKLQRVTHNSPLWSQCVR